MSKQLPLAAMDACCSPLVRAPLTQEQAVELSRLFKAMADPVRLRLLSLIASHAGVRCVSAT